jgi:tetratricopeptide (TPR) repeat protein
METETFSKEEVARASAAFVNVKLDADKEEKLWKETYRGEGLPTTFVVTGEGEILARVVGYRPAKDYEELLKALPDRVRKLREAQAAVAKDTEDTAALMALADAQKALEAEAVDSYERVVKLLYRKDTLDDAQKLRLANACAEAALLRYEEEKWADVIRLAEIRAKADPEDKAGRGDQFVPLVAAARFLGEEKLDEAIKVITEGIAKYPKSKRLDQMMYLHGALLHEKGEEAKAKEVWREAAKKFPDTAWGKKAKEAAEHEHR